MNSLPLQLDPTLPPLVAQPIAALTLLLQRYGWTALITLAALFVAHRYYSSWRSRRESQSVASDGIERLRQTRLAQQAAWSQQQQTSSSSSSSVNASTPTTGSTHARALNRRYGADPSQERAAGAPEEELSFEEVFGPGFDQDYYRVSSSSSNNTAE